MSSSSERTELIRQRQLEAALEATEQLTRGILAAVPAGVVHVAPDGSVRSANAEAVRLLGLDPDELTHRTAGDFEPSTLWEDGSPCRAEDYPVTRALVTGEPQPAVTIGVRRPDGELSWCVFRAVPVKDSAGSTTGAVVTFHDITERKRTEDALRRSQAELQAIVASAPSIIFTADREGRVTFVNRPARSGADAPESVFDWINSRDHERAREHMRRVLEERTVVELEIEGLEDRDPNVYSARIGPIERDGEVFGLAGVITVVTERKRAEAERVQLLEQLGEARRLEALGRLAGGIAHDFNNLLTVILGSIDMVKRRVGDTAARSRLEEIGGAASRAAHLTRQLLAFGRRQALELHHVELGDVVASVQELLQRLLGEHIELVVERAAGRCTVIADATELERVIVNLAMNAQDAMPDGGTLCIGTRAVSVAAGDIAGVEAGAYAVLEVRDSGNGMDADTRARIFEPFFTTKPLGAGLGLATVHGIVKQSGGHIAVDSASDRGTRVTVLLPRAPAKRHRSAPAAQAVNTRGSETILLVEDEPLVRRVARRVLEAEGYRVVVAESGEEALTIGDELLDAVELLLSDVVMPRVSGPAVAARLSERKPQLKVLFMSGHVKRAYGELPEGVAFLPKPFDAPTLAAKVRAVLDG